MKKLLSLVVLSLYVVGWTPLQAVDNKEEMDHHKPYHGSKQLEQIKSLVGTWEGTDSSQKKEMKITVTYQVTSAGSAVIEKSFPDTPFEMVSVYHDKKGKLSMTHYCALKNQPILNLKKADKNNIHLSFSKESSLNHKKDPHMHSLSIEFIDDNKIIQKWTMYENGKSKQTSEFELTRKS